MSLFKIMIILIALNLINVRICAAPSYIGCFQDCLSGTCGNTVNQYSNGREVQMYGAYSGSMTNEFCINKCTSLGNFIYAATQNG